MGRQRINCACCGQLGYRDSIDTGWVRACADRWRDAGRPDTGPPPPRRRGPGRAATRQFAKYVALVELGWSPTRIAWQLSVSGRTVERYAARHRTLTTKAQNRNAA